MACLISCITPPTATFIVEMVFGKVICFQMIREANNKVSHYHFWEEEPRAQWFSYLDFLSSFYFSHQTSHYFFYKVYCCSHVLLEAAWNCYPYIFWSWAIVHCFQKQPNRRRFRIEHAMARGKKRRLDGFSLGTFFLDFQLTPHPPAPTLYCQVFVAFFYEGHLK